MTRGISETLLLDARVIDDPYPFYGRLRAEAPVWEAPGTGVFTVSTFELVAEASSRVEDFSSNIRALLYRDAAGLPCRLPFGGDGMQALATADPPTHVLHRGAVFPELVAKRMAELEPAVTELADACVTEALEVGSVEFMGAIGNVVPITMISRLIGFQDANIDQLLRAAFDSTAMLGSTLLLWGSANRDDAEFEHPDEIDLTRRVPRRHVSFGRGIHHCVGAPLARIEARAVLAVLLDRTSDIALDFDSPPRWANSLMVRRHDTLPIRLTAG